MSKIILRFTIVFNEKSNLIPFENKSRLLHSSWFHIDQFLQGSEISMEGFFNTLIFSNDWIKKVKIGS